MYVKRGTMTDPAKKSYFFCAIGGMGMSALAQILVACGHSVSGSDRSYDMGEAREKFQKLAEMGITLYPQDGSGIKKSGADVFVVSTAVEDTVPDVKAAKECGLLILHRAELLAQIASMEKLLTIGGTSGKSTTTGMLGHILSVTGKNPTVINGALMCDTQEGLGNVTLGGTKLCVAEVDESDGSIKNFAPQIAALLNIALDHKSMEELRDLFSFYLKSAQQGVVLNKNCAETMALQKYAQVAVKTFSLTDSTADVYATDLQDTPQGISFKLNNEIPVTLRVLGAHNVENALAAIAMASFLGVPLAEAGRAVATFKGMQRRLEVLGSANGIRVVDDFAHNPHKIAASLKTLCRHKGRTFIVYQPHGFGPTKMLRKDLVSAFVQNLRPQDQVWLPEIYFVGGTADKSISSADLVADLQQQNIQAHYTEARADITPQLVQALRPGDIVAVMGARDVTLTNFAHQILETLSTQK